MKKSRFASLLSLVVLSLSACTVNPLISRVDHGSDSDPSAPGSSSSQPASQNSGSGRSSSSSRASSSQPSVPPADYVGEYAPKFVEDGKFLYYGLYPLSHIKDASLCEAISERGVPQPNGWFLYEGQYYANQFGNPSFEVSDPKFIDGERILRGKLYWFLCEPIRWRVLGTTSESRLILTDFSIEAHCYGAYYGGMVDGLYANNYEHSEIRDWLNSTFYETAFFQDPSFIKETVVDNSPASALTRYEPFACNDTYDRVFLLSMQEYTSTRYGFSRRTDLPSEARKSYTTDWTRAAGAWYSETSTYLLYGAHWSRSPSDIAGYRVSGIYEDGSSDSFTTDALLGVRPALNLIL